MAAATARPSGKVMHLITTGPGMAALVTTTARRVKIRHTGDTVGTPPMTSSPVPIGSVDIARPCSVGVV